MGRRLDELEKTVSWLQDELIGLKSGKTQLRSGPSPDSESLDHGSQFVGMICRVLQPYIKYQEDRSAIARDILVKVQEAGWEHPKSPEEVDVIISNLSHLNDDRCACTLNDPCKAHPHRFTEAEMKEHDRELVEKVRSMILRRNLSLPTTEQMLDALGLGKD